MQSQSKGSPPPGGATGDNKNTDERGTWGSSFEFVLSCLGYAVGLGNVWRFPMVCYMNGGGAFLIPYFIMLVVVGLPVFFIELLVAQYSGCGPVTIWSCAPLFKGIGFGMILITSMLSVFYCMLLGYSLFYLVMSFQKHLPWDNCQHDYNTEYCYTKSEAEGCEEKLNGTWFNQTCYNGTYLETMDPVEKSSLMDMTKKIVSSSEEYFMLGVLEVSPNIEHTDGIKWELVVALGAAWFLCFLCVVRGIRSSGKVVYFTAIFPYVVLLVLFIRALTLPGASKGVRFFIEPQWEKLKDEQVWADAAGQIFFTLSVGGGGLMTFASYNKFHNNIYRDTMIVAFGNCITSVFAGCVIFAILGYMAHIQQQEVADVVTAGAGLAFIAYPTVVSQLPISQLWAILFFLMLITLGLDSLFGGIEVVMTTFTDMFPKARRWKPLLAFLICLFYFICGLTLCTRAGLYWLDLISYYATGWSLIVMALVEVLVFGWIYGARKLMQMVEEMTGSPLHCHWWFWWKFLIPAALVAILVFNLRDFKPMEYGDYTNPDWAQFLGWSMTLVSILVIFVMAVVQIFRSYKDPEYDGLHLGQRICKLCKPTKEWGPNKCRPQGSDATTDKAANNGYAGAGYNTTANPDAIELHSNNTYISEDPYNSSPAPAAYNPGSYSSPNNYSTGLNGNPVSVIQVGYDNGHTNRAFNHI